LEDALGQTEEVQILENTYQRGMEVRRKKGIIPTSNRDLP